MDSSTEKKRRGRKAKIETVNVITDPEINTVVEEKIPKKRGRKPKGGKVVNNVQNDNIISNIIPNIILHLRCSRQDIDNCNENNQIDTYQFNNTKNYDFNYLQLSNSVTNNNNISLINSDNTPNPIGDNTSDTTKMIWQKLEKLSTSLHIDNICDKKSACFFCTCDFDNTPIYIPKFQLNNLFHVYGCFCSPECACAYLMNEKNIDSTCRFERYYLLNYIYCKIYDYKKNIKPAPSPFYLLDKYYGTLSIQEYRKLLKSERLLLVVDKPLVRSMPELHDDSDDYLLNAKGIPAAINKYIPQKEFKNVTKNDILNEQFNIK